MNPNGLSQAEKKLLQGLGEKHQFQAEVSRLLNLIINSLYSKRDIFLRELISNASDALDKIRFLALTGEASLGDNTQFEIKIKADKEARVLHIQDTGLGMTKQDLISNLGIIAKSGTNEFLSKMASTEDSGLIGQFGVGFYSAFLVADRVTVTSKHNDDKQHVWTSTADGEFAVTEDPEGDTLGRGTRISLHLREDALEFLESEALRKLVATYSSFINFPIYLWSSKTVQVQVPKDEAAESPKEDEALHVEDNEEGDNEEEADDEPETVTETVWDWDLLNNIKPLWTRDPKEITDDEYIQFYKVITKDSDNPVSWSHFHAEGDIDFRAIIYLPSDTDENQFDTTKTDGNRGLKLYVKRVFITDQFDSILPKYLAFVKGVIDSTTLPLNVSREILQQDKSLKAMEKKLVRKIIALIQSLAQDEEKYEEFYDQFSVNLKLGIIEDSGNRDRLSKLLRFHSSKSGNQQISLEHYIEGMKEGQDKIYYIAGESRSIVASSPLIERLTSKGYEVLFFVEPIDEYWTQHLSTFDGKRLVNVARDGDLGIEGEEEKEKNEEDAKNLESLVKFLKTTLSSKITKCVVSKRLTKTPSALVASSFGYSANMERIMKAQALSAGQDSFMAPKKILEINPSHPIIKELLRRINGDAEDPIAKDIAELMFDTAALHSGFSLDDPSKFASRVHKMMSLGLNLDENEQEVVEEVDVEEDGHIHHDEL